MAVFLQSDAALKKAFGGQWGPNFLNDGVITNDFLKTGLAAELVAQYGDAVSSDLESRFKREKKCDVLCASFSEVSNSR